MTSEQILLSLILAIFGATGFWTFVTEVWKSHRDKKRKKDELNPEDIKLLKEGTLALLHDRLYQACHFYLNQGKIDEDGYKNLGSVYNAYHGLGGNGTGTELYNRTIKLKIVEDLRDDVKK